jgi:DnaJ-like protein
MAIRTAMTCPHCGTRTVETVRKVWFLHGFLLFARYGTKRIIGCRSCATREVWRNFSICLVGGWWCFPWGLGNPLVLLQNAVAALWVPTARDERQQLEKLLDDVGLKLADVETDADGFTAEHKEMIGRLASVLKEATHADSVAHPAERQLAIRMLQQFTSAKYSSEICARLIEDASPFIYSDLPHDQRVSLLQAATLIAAADSSVELSEHVFLLNLGARLGFPGPYVHRLVQRVLAGEEPIGEVDGDFSDVALARTTLGVGGAATIAEIKRKYRELIVLHHPDIAIGKNLNRQQAEDITKRLNWAYDVLKRETSMQAVS